MNVSSLTPWLSDFHTIRFSISSGYFFVLKFVVLLLVVQGGTVYLPMLPSWPEVSVSALLRGVNTIYFIELWILHVLTYVKHLSQNLEQSTGSIKIQLTLLGPLYGGPMIVHTLGFLHHGTTDIWDQITVGCGSVWSNIEYLAASLASLHYIQ